VVGLSTAINIKKVLPNATVKVIADKFNHETTSYGAGGLFRPTKEHIPGVPKDLLR
jgi:D-aspartate oxidase